MICNPGHVFTNAVCVVCADRYAPGATLGLSQLLLVSGYNRELGISDQFFSLGDTVVLTVLGEVSALGRKRQSSRLRI
jgi:hypothetical protein